MLRGSLAGCAFSFSALQEYRRLSRCGYSGCSTTVENMGTARQPRSRGTLPRRPGASEPFLATNHKCPIACDPSARVAGLTPWRTADYRAIATPGELPIRVSVMVAKTHRRIPEPFPPYVGRDSFACAFSQGVYCAPQGAVCHLILDRIACLG